MTPLRNFLISFFLTNLPLRTTQIIIMETIQSIKGFADLFSPESDNFSFLEATAREVFGRYGVSELRTPILEKTELFARGIGGETDVVQKEMYTFEDKGGRSVTLRPEATAGVVRAFIESGQHAPERVSKYFTIGPMFRYERPQKGRLRQFHQINCEVFGTDAPHCDAEVMLMLATFLKSVGLSGLSFEVNSLGCPECRPTFHQRLTDYFSGLDKGKLCADCLRRTATNPLRVLDCKVAACKDVVAEAPRIDDNLCPSCKTHFDTVLSILDAAGLAYTRNPFLVRGLDYYQRTTFEVTSTNIGAQTAVAGGGRYDGLVELLGGPKVPGVGFAIGMERLALLLAGREPARKDFYLAVLDEKALDQGLLLAQKLRERGLSGEVSFAAKSPKSQLRLANKLGVKTCLLLGGEELAAGTIVVKSLDTGEQTSMPQEQFLATLG
ncbi:Histidyl-tRNA synthetase [Desulfocurvibacter africanus subsp. africanus str. Walvis Bay]|uniref:Histidine--tRNA ligase n=3 Tax=Desulfocurvibacter africanus TaxID=873 RepID=F3YVU7_DESAF|nr:Histidyl-tRNA synthetase [Desulfocurvibacter africanus subsp. africanus str. Walvis Bay]